MQTKRLLWAPALAALIAGTFSAMAIADDDRGDRGEPYAIGLWGDLPYSDVQAQVGVPNLIADMNRHELAFTVHDGDLKAGSGTPGSVTPTTCGDALYVQGLAFFNALRAPAMFTPGDNDWTDCWGRYGPGTGDQDPEERLNHERVLFFSTDRSLGRTTLRLTRESSEGGAYAQYAENVRWTRGPVVYIGLNVQGSNDNYPYAGVDGETRSDEEINRQRAEQAARKAANMHWLDEGFAHAKQIGAKGIMIIWQANPNFNNEQHLTDPRSWDAYPDYVNALRDRTMAFSGQVVLVHGDSHYFIVDKPINTPTGGVLANFTRVETFGARNTHWVSATIDPHAPNVFMFEPRIVRANAD